MKKWIPILLIVLVTGGVIAYLFRTSIPFYTDFIAPTISRTITWAKLVVINNPLEWFMGSIGGIVASLTAITKVWGALKSKKAELTTTVNQLQTTAGLSLSKLQEEKDRIIGEKTALFDANQTLTSELQLVTAKLGTIPQLETELEKMTQQYEDARLQLQTLHEFQQKIDTEQIGKILADAQRVK